MRRQPLLVLLALRASFARELSSRPALLQRTARRIDVKLGAAGARLRQLAQRVGELGDARACRAGQPR